MQSRLLKTQSHGSLSGPYEILGSISRDQGADEDALAWFRKARAECEKQPSPNIVDLAEKLENEAALLKRLGRTIEAAEVEKELAQLRAITVPSLPYALGSLASMNASGGGKEEAVLIELDGTKLSSSDYKEYDLKSLEDQLEAAIEKEGAAEFDGHEFGPKNITLFLYGPDAETLFQAVEPVLRQYPLCQRASVTIRQGTGERQVVI